MSPRLPIALRNALAELVIRALEVDPQAERDRDAARAAIVLLVAYGRLAAAAGPAVPTSELLAVARRHPTPEPLDYRRGLEQLRATLMNDVRSESRAGERITLRPDFLPLLQAIEEHARRSQAVVESCVTLAAAREREIAGVVGRSALLFNAGLFFEVHEVLEAAWRTATGGERVLLQGLLQIAVALYHYGQANYGGARSLLRAGYGKARSASAFAPAVVDIDAFLAAVATWLAFLDAARQDAGPSAPAPPLPHFSFAPEAG
jgi:hypothetical protein